MGDWRASTGRAKGAQALTIGLSLALLVASAASAQAPPTGADPSAVGDAASPRGGDPASKGDGAPSGAAPAEDPATSDPVVAPPVRGEVSMEQSFAVVIGGKPVAVDANADAPPRASVGTPLLLSLKVVRPAGTSLALPGEQDTGRFELLGVERAPEVVEPGAASIVETIHLRFAVWRPGRHVLEAFSLKIMDAEGGISSVTTRPVDVLIASVIANEADPKMADPRPPVSVWVEDWVLVWIGGVLLSLLIAGLLGAWLYRVLGPKPPPPPPPPPRPAHEIALEKLGAVAAANLPEQGLVEEFYVRVSEAVREYLGRRYNLSLTDQAGLELTTEELIGLLREVRWPRGVSMRFVEALLYDCDIVKFARYTPADDEVDDLLRRAFQLVELTRITALGDAALSADPHGAAQKVDATDGVDAGSAPDARSAAGEVADDAEGDPGAGPGLKGGEQDA